MPKLRAALDALVAAGAPGAVVLVRDGDRTVRLVRGLADRTRKAPVRVTDRFRVGSVVAMGPPGESYGLGLWKTASLGLSPTNKLACGPVWGHDGDFPGYLTDAFSSEDAGRQMVVLVNSDSLRRPAQRALVRVGDIAACA